MAVVYATCHLACHHLACCSVLVTTYLGMIGETSPLIKPLQHMSFGPRIKPFFFTSPVSQPYREVSFICCWGMAFKQLSTHGYARKAPKVSLLDERQFVT